MTAWLTIVGLGEDGADGLSPAALRALAQAELVVGGQRHLALVDTGAAETLAWPSPIEQAYPAILARHRHPVVVLASGDPFFHGIGSVLAGLVDPAEIACFPAPSAYALAAARLGWAGQDCVRVTLHGRALERILPHLHPGARILALSWDGSTPAAAAALLTRHGFGGSTITVLERMGGPRERIRSARVDALDLADVDPLNTLAIQVEAGPDARAIPFTPGLPDEWFETDGQITKREVRAVTLSALRPMRHGLLIDIGAGSGSVGIEWMLADPSCRTVAIEPRSERAARILRNAANLGVPDLTLVEGVAPDALAGLPPADAVFIGGGAGSPGMLDAVIGALKPGGRLVVNAVALETQALVAGWHGARRGDLAQIAIARAEPLGGFRGLRPAMAVLQWAWTKPFGIDS
jgi:precorrin-6B C5,15-methyltransferase / cobalt-precorrin-6B C5,C15-methyltransferase